jgi:hypothetical protein
MKIYIFCAEAALLLQQSSFSKKWKTMKEQPRNPQFFVRSFIIKSQVLSIFETTETRGSFCDIC